jgi:hypothetical protein
VVAETSRTGQGLYDISKGMSAKLAERKASPLFEIALVLVRRDHVASVNHKRGSRHHVSGCDPCDENVTETSLI